MIVRCSNCNSAFAVDDTKVDNKKFAFTCPKCSEENVIDNRSGMMSKFEEPAVLDEEIRAETAAPGSQDLDFEEALVNAERSDKSGEALTTEGPDLSFDEGSDVLGDADFGRPGDDDSLSLSDELGEELDADLFTDKELTGELADLPPADDMELDIPLDDLPIEPIDSSDLSQSTTFDELSDEIGDFSTDDRPIRDEMDELQLESDSPVELDSFDDIEEALAEDDRDILDEFEPIDEDLSPGLDIAEDSDMLQDDIKAEEVYPSEDVDEDESITIDLDSLEIDLEEGDEDVVLADDSEDYSVDSLDFSEAGEKAEISEPDSGLGDDITLDLDDLDIDLEETEGIKSGESPEELDLDVSDFSEEPEGSDIAGEDEDITLNIDDLDISLEESDEIHTGEVLDDDEKLTLEDAGLTMEELTGNEISSMREDERDIGDEDDIKLTIDEIDPELSVENIEDELKEAESILAESNIEDENLLIDEFEDLPDIDFDEDVEIDQDAVIMHDKAGVPEDDLTHFEDDSDIYEGGIRKELPDMVPRGTVNFSIDYSIKYSRIGALLRLVGLFFIGMIPHFVVFFIYNILSIILGFLNHIVVIFTGKNIEDFSEIHENTIRYIISISSSLVGIVEEMPIFAGRDNIDFPLQMRIVFPLRSSRIMALLRVSMLGIMFMTLPHLIILTLLSMFIPFIYIIGVFSVIITARWPHILFDFMVRYYRYNARVLAYSIGIVDEYPTFRFN